MLYKVTPMMAPPDEAKVRKRREPGQPRKRRKTAIYDGEGHEVLITLMCLKCKSMKPLAQFGLRKMADGAVRNQPWCRTCRSAAGTKPKKVEAELEQSADAEVVPLSEPVPAGVEQARAEVAAEPVQLSADSTSATVAVTAELVSAPASAELETTQPMIAQAEQEPELPAPLAAEPAQTLGQ